jgi:hypothetical protein
MASVSNSPAAAGSADLPSEEERRALIERVAASEQFSRSARLRDFLLYVGEQSLKDGSPDVHEQEIGEKVFGRPAAYDRSQDNIVRVNATELRKRIELYFASAGARESVVFEIPRGGYKLIFRRRTKVWPSEYDSPLGEDPSSPVSAVHAAPAAPGRQNRLRTAVPFVWPALSLALGIACTLLYLQNRALQKSVDPWENEPAVKAFWTGFLSPNKETNIVLSDDAASVIEDITHKPISLDDYQDREFLHNLQESTTNTDLKTFVTQIFNHDLIAFGAVRAAQLVASEIPSNYPHHFTFTRYFTTDEMNRDNVVLVGGRKSVPWDYLFDSQLNFITDFDYTRDAAIVRNLHPKLGENATYGVPQGPNNFTGYATVAYLPNLSHTGSIILLGGTDSEATGAAASFLTSEDQMEKLREALHVRTFPYFEVLLRTPRLGSAFFDPTLVAYRTYPRIP